MIYTISYQFAPEGEANSTRFTAMTKNIGVAASLLSRAQDATGLEFSIHEWLTPYVQTKQLAASGRFPWVELKIEEEQPST